MVRDLPDVFFVSSWVPDGGTDSSGRTDSRHRKSILDKCKLRRSQINSRVCTDKMTAFILLGWLFQLPFSYFVIFLKLNINQCNFVICLIMPYDPILIFYIFRRLFYNLTWFWFIGLMITINYVHVYLFSVMISFNRWGSFCLPEFVNHLLSSYCLRSPNRFQDLGF